MTKRYDTCEICGKELTYLSESDEKKTITCYYCAKKFDVKIYCGKGHYICDQCHSKNAKEVTINFCKETRLTDPFQIADEIMKHPNFKIYGPEHHFLVPAAILTALKNLGVNKLNGTPIAFQDVLEAIKRGATIPGGYCGFFGSCGSGVGTGIVISIFTGANPSKDVERSLANKMTARVLLKVADNMEHCCKRSLKYAICEALEFLTENFDLKADLNYVPEKCVFSEINPKCVQVKCPFN